MLGVRGLPEQEVGGALLAGRAQEQVHLGHLGVVEVLARTVFSVTLSGLSRPAATSRAIAAAASAISAWPP